jgi:predicted SnoaL-like aldol condensation-catalyzing enzyme
VDVAKMVELSTRWWHEVWRDGDVDVVDEILTDPFVRHSATGTTTASRDDYKRMLTEFQHTLHRPATSIDARDIVGDRIWTRATSRGVNLKTGERSVVSWLLLQRIDNDRITEHWALAIAGVDWTA